jgi:hypothetical protein
MVEIRRYALAAAARNSRPMPGVYPEIGRGASGFGGGAMVVGRRDGSVTVWRTR